MMVPLELGFLFSKSNNDEFIFSDNGSMNFLLKVYFLKGQ